MGNVNSTGKFQFSHIIESGWEFYFIHCQKVVILHSWYTYVSNYRFQVSRGYLKIFFASFSLFKHKKIWIIFAPLLQVFFFSFSFIFILNLLLLFCTRKKGWTHSSFLLSLFWYWKSFLRPFASFNLWENVVLSCWVICKDCFFTRIWWDYFLLRDTWKIEKIAGKSSCNV